MEVYKYCSNYEDDACDCFGKCEFKSKSEESNSMVTPDKEENKENDFVESLIDEIMQFGCGMLEFHTKDITRLINIIERKDSENTSLKNRIEELEQELVFQKLCQNKAWYYIEEDNIFHCSAVTSRYYKEERTKEELIEIFRSGKERKNE